MIFHKQFKFALIKPPLSCTHSSWQPGFMTGAQKERSGREDNMEKQGHSLPRPMLGDLDQEPAMIPELFKLCVTPQPVRWTWTRSQPCYRGGRAIWHTIPSLGMCRVDNTIIYYTASCREAYTIITWEKGSWSSIIHHYFSQVWLANENRCTREEGIKSFLTP